MPTNLILGLALGSAATGAGAWSPNDLGAALLAWWDSSQGVSLAGSQVTAWADRKNGYNPAQGTSAARPTYSDNSFNGAPGVSFDGADDYLELANQPFASGAGESEIWGVCQQDSLPADTAVRMLMSYGGDASASRRSLVGFGNGASVYQLVAQVGNGTTAVGTGGVAGFTGRHLARGAFGATATSASLDGGALATQAVVPATGTSRVRIGSTSNSSPGNLFKGIIRDLIVTGPLTSDQVTQLQNFLLARRMP